MVNKVKILRLLCGEFRPKLGVCLNSLDLRSMLQLGVFWRVEAHIIGKCLRFYLKVYLWSCSLKHKQKEPHGPLTKGSFLFHREVGIEHFIILHNPTSSNSCHVPGRYDNQSPTLERTELVLGWMSIAQHTVLSTLIKSLASWQM